MALFQERKVYEIIREGDDIILKIDYDKYSHPPSVEDNGICMGTVIDLLAEVNTVTKILLYQKRDYEYDMAQTKLLLEIARLYKQLRKQKDIIGIGGIAPPTAINPEVSQKFLEIQNIVFRLLKTDPLGAYVETKRLLRRENISIAKQQQISNADKRLLFVLKYLNGALEKTQLVTVSQPYLAGFKIGDRSVYRKIFAPSIKPDFMFTKVMSNYPADGEELDSYIIGDNTEVTIFSLPDTVQYLYHVTPPEFKLTEEKYEILDLARKIIAEHKPKRSEFVDPERMRAVFFNVGHDLIEELCNYRNIKLTEKELKELTEILVRYTVGFGLIEVLLQDEKIQDISINSPQGQIPMFIVHQEFDDCKTNIIPTPNEAESWATKLRLISGRPLDEANPILDTELELPGASTRVSAITRPLDPSGLAFSFRRHRDKPWTLPLFMQYKMLNSFSAALISFLVDGSRAMLIAGTRSSGKSSLLSAILIEIMRRYRLITVEDTLELPTNSLRKLGYNVQPMKVSSALSKSTTEMGADDGIRATLRLGDSALIVGEVRSTEAKALYEAMRVGAAANIVAGTIHGDSPYGIFDRVVNDIGVPKTSFKATDICIIANPIRSADGLHKYRRVLQITEVRKKWSEDPMLEGGFMDLMKYDPNDDQIKATPDFINGDSEILKTIAGNVKEYAGSWDAVWNNIELRSKIKQTQLDYATKLNKPDMLEAQFTILCNDMFHKISEQVKNEVGSMDPKRIYFQWEEWIKRQLKKSTMENNDY